MKTHPGRFVHMNTLRAATRPTRLETAHARNQPIPDDKARKAQQQALVIEYKAANYDASAIAESGKSLFWSTGALGASGLIVLEKLALGAEMSTLVTTLLAGACAAGGAFLWKQAQLPAGTSLSTQEAEQLTRTRYLAHALGLLWITGAGVAGHFLNAQAAVMISTALYGLALTGISSYAEGKDLRTTVVDSVRRYAANRG